MNDCIAVAPNGVRCQTLTPAEVALYHRTQDMFAVCKRAPESCYHHEYQPPEAPPLTIDITPSDEGYTQIAVMFAEQVLADVKANRKASDRELLVSVIETAAYLASKGNGVLIKQVIESVRNGRD